MDDGTNRKIKKRKHSSVQALEIKRHLADGSVLKL